MGVDTWREQLMWMYSSGVEGERGSYDGSTSLFNRALNENGRCILNNPFAPKLEWIFTAGLGSLRKVGEAAASSTGGSDRGNVVSQGGLPVVVQPQAASANVCRNTHRAVCGHQLVRVVESRFGRARPEDALLVAGLTGSYVRRSYRALLACCSASCRGYFGNLSGRAMNAAAAILSGLFAAAGSVGGSFLFAA
ncbi:hypothetical protein DFJ73DRAFT_853228, partial [Zopfochytrium polystomum]